MEGSSQPSSAAMELTTYVATSTHRPVMDLYGPRRPRPGWSNLVPKVTLPDSMELSRPSESPDQPPQAASRLPETATVPMMAAIRVIERDMCSPLNKR